MEEGVEVLGEDGLKYENKKKRVLEPYRLDCFFSFFLVKLSLIFFTETKELSITISVMLVWTMKQSNVNKYSEEKEE